MTQLLTALSDEQAQHIAGGRWTIVEESLSITGEAYKSNKGSMWSVDYSGTMVNNGGNTKDFEATFTGKKNEVDTFIASHSS